MLIKSEQSSLHIHASYGHNTWMRKSGLIACVIVIQKPLWSFNCDCTDSWMLLSFLSRLMFYKTLWHKGWMDHLLQQVIHREERQSHGKSSGASWTSFHSCIGNNLSWRKCTEVWRLGWGWITIILHVNVQPSVMLSLALSATKWSQLKQFKHILFFFRVENLSSWDITFNFGHT